MVLTICRLSSILETGSVVSKLDAARWAQTTHNPGRKALIQRALIGQHPEQGISSQELQETLAFLDETLKRIQER